MMQNLYIDIETRSSVDLKKGGVYRYASSFDFDLLLFGYAADDGEVKVIDLASGETLPDEVLHALVSDNKVKWAHNCTFERVCLSCWLRKHYPALFSGNYLDPKSWRCTMVLAAYNGLPLSLEKVGSVLGFEEQKLKEGRDLVRYFCTPSRTESRKWNLPEHAPDRWETFKAYNKRDVEVEMQILRRLQKYMVPNSVWEEYRLDQEINDRGIMIDRRLVEQAIRIDELSKSSLTAEMIKRTGLANPNSVVQLKSYLTQNGIDVDTIGKKEVAAMIKKVPADIAQVLSLRLQLAKSSIKKFAAMQNTACSDDRCHGMFQFYGARTGRWAGRQVQLQNLKRNGLPDLEQARELVRRGDYEMLSMLYDSVPNVLSELIRTAFIPTPGYKFIVSDYSAIEARVLSLLASEQWRLDVFHHGRDIYCETASRMFGCIVEKNGQNSHLRQKGKISELALGYGGSVGALKAMGALDMGLAEEELQPLVNMWRRANPHIVQYWWDVDAAVKKTIRDKVPTKVGCVRFEARNGMLFIYFPSGRRLSYVKPQITENAYGNESVTYMGVDNTKHWGKIESYGPKFVENITQGLSRDILCYAMRTLSHCRIVGHVHDELIIEVSKDTPLDTITGQMGRTPPWLPGLELRADGFECMFYKKD